jgi:hypothetical protein
MMLPCQKSSDKQVEFTQSIDIGFSYSDVMASDPLPSMDVNVPSPAQLHADTPFDRQMVSVSKAEHYISG